MQRKEMLEKRTSGMTAFGLETMRPARRASSRERFPTRSSSLFAQLIADQKTIERKNGEPIPNHVMRAWFEPRREYPELFEKGVGVWRGGAEKTQQSSS